MKEKREVISLNLDDILPNRFQPRIKFDEKAIIELSESIKEHGVIQPIIVRRISDKYEIIAGERRYKASVMAGKTTIPAIIVDLNDKDSSEIALIENVQRQDLTPIEEAISYRKILDMDYLTQDELATKLGVSQSTIANKLRLLNLADEVQDALLDQKISERHARSLLKLSKENQQTEMLNRIINERLTVRKTDEEIDKMIKGKDNVTTLDSLENNVFNENSDFQQIVPNDSVNNNPFILNNSLNENLNNDTSTLDINNINSNPIEVLDFGESEIINNNMPSTPIVEDKIEEVVNTDSMNTEMPNTSIEQDNLLENNDMSFNFNQSNIVNEFDSNDTNDSILQSSNPEYTFEQNNIVTPEVDESNNDVLNDSIETTQPLENINLSNNESVIETNTNTFEETSEPELRPGRFFNILNTDYETEDQDNVSNNNVFELNNDAPVENQVDESQNIFNQSPTQDFKVFNQQIQESQNQLNQQLEEDNSIIETENNISPEQNSEVFSFNYDVPPVVPVYDDNIQTNVEPVKEEPQTEEEPKEMTLRDIINMVRNCANEIEKNNFEIDCEEFDFEDIYQIIFKIKK